MSCVCTRRSCFVASVSFAPAISSSMARTIARACSGARSAFSRTSSDSACIVMMISGSESAVSIALAKRQKTIAPFGSESPRSKVSGARNKLESHRDHVLAGGNHDEHSSDLACGSAARRLRHASPSAGAQMGRQLGRVAASAEPGRGAVPRDAELRRPNRAAARAPERRRRARALAAHERVRHEAAHRRRRARRTRGRRGQGQARHRARRDFRRPPDRDHSGRRAAALRSDRSQGRAISRRCP